MSYYCPICNGLQSLSAQCPKCLTSAEDCGRMDDYLGPYSPYRQAEDISLSNGYADVQNHVCIHCGYCAECGSTFPVSVGQWSGNFS